MLAFRTAANTNNLLEMQRLSLEMADNFKIDEPGPKSGKTAAHFAAEKAHFNAIYWLYDKGADFYCKDKEDKTALDYLQQKELAFPYSNPMVKEDRKYYLCNAHYKIWLAHDPNHFMPYLYQHDFVQYREKNPDGYMSLVYSINLLSETALLELKEFAKKHQITLISFEEDLSRLTKEFGTAGDLLCYEWASYELSQYLNKKGGNPAVVADLIRWSSVLLRIGGNYIDTDVKVGKYKWTDSIIMEKPLALNIGSLIHPGEKCEPWINGDIIAVSSLFPRPHHKTDFKITISKTAGFIIQKVQYELISNCQNFMKKRIAKQEAHTTVLSDISRFFKDFFTSPHCFGIEIFTSSEITKIQANGLDTYSSEERASILERMANMLRKSIEEEYETPEMANKYNEILRNAKSDEHEKFLMYHMQFTLMLNIKKQVKHLTGSPVFIMPILKCINNDDWKKYSIYSNEQVRSAFRSKNTVKFDTKFEDNKRLVQTKQLADLSFTSLGMIDVLKRSEALKATHMKIDK